MKFLLSFFTLLTGCTTARNATSSFETTAQVKSLTLYENGRIEAVDIGSPLANGIQALNNAMLGTLFLK